MAQEGGPGKQTGDLTLGGKVGAAAGAVVAVVVYFLFLRPTGEGGGYLPASGRTIVIALTLILAALGGFAGDMIDKALRRGQ